ncbi:MAG: DeoR family transcriptional regulator, partial [Bacteroidales bacterium]|nr:DeoR family transcriptional regulator [Bacteroidales bacterium]
STSGKVADKMVLQQKMVDKWSIKPSLAQKMADILFYVADKEDFTTEEIISHFGYAETTAKRYLRQLAEFGYLEAHGGNRNRRYSCLKTSVPSSTTP